MGDAKTESAVKPQDDRPGCWGLAYVDWMRVFGVFVCLWAALALIFWALLEIGLQVRGNQYLNMEQRFFGSFERPLIPVVEINADSGRTTLVNVFNRAAVC